MADLDTALKRASAVNVSMPWRTPGKYPPSATFGKVERSAVAFMYGGIEAASASVEKKRNAAFEFSGDKIYGAWFSCHQVITGKFSRYENARS